MIFLLIPFALLAAGLVYQTVGLAIDRKRLPPPGQLVSCGRNTFHIHTQGEGNPVVVLEAGIGGTSLGWALVQPKIAKFTTVCSYDRLSLGWSSACTSARTVEQTTSELRELLASSSLPAPYILVGHSFGGLLVRAFAARFPELTAAVILVDPVSIDAWIECSDQDLRRLNRGIRLAQRGALLARFGIVRAALTLLVSGSRILPKLIGRTAAPGANRFMERMVGQIRQLPKELWPAIQSHWSDQKCFSGMAGYLRALPNCAKDAAQLHPPAHVPQIILSAATATQGELRERDKWVQDSSLSRHIRLHDAGHWIQLDQPEALLETVRNVIENVRSQAVI